MLFCWGSFPTWSFWRMCLWRPSPGPYGTPLQSLLCFSVQFSSPPFLSVHCQLNKSICLRRTIWNEPTVNNITEEGNRRGSEMGFWTYRQRAWPVGDSIPPTVLKITSTSSDLSRQTGPLREYYLSAMFVQQKEETRTCFVYIEGNSRNSEII